MIVLISLLTRKLAKLHTHCCVNQSGGYTLIELVVVVGVIIVLTGASITGYIAYNERQNVRNTTDELVVFLESAKQKAVVRQKPEDCDYLRGFQVVTADKKVEMYALCSLTPDGTYAVQDEVVSSFGVPTIVTLSTIDITFLTLFDGVILTQPSNGIITITADEYTQTVRVTEGGAIELITE